MDITAEATQHGAMYHRGGEVAEVWRNRLSTGDTDWWLFIYTAEGVCMYASLFDSEEQAAGTLADYWEVDSLPEVVTRDSLRASGIKWTDALGFDCESCGGTVLVSGYPQTVDFEKQTYCGALDCKNKPTHWEHIGDGDHIGWCEEHRDGGLTMAQPEPTAWAAFEDDDCYCQHCGAVGVLMVSESTCSVSGTDAPARFVREEDR